MAYMLKLGVIYMTLKPTSRTENITDTKIKIYTFVERTTQFGEQP